MHEIEIQKIVAFSDIQFSTKNSLFFRCSVYKFSIQNTFIENELFENVRPNWGGNFGFWLKRARINSPPPLSCRNYKWYEFFFMLWNNDTCMDIEQLKTFWNKNTFFDFFNFWRRHQIWVNFCFAKYFLFYFINSLCIYIDPNCSCHEWFD